MRKLLAFVLLSLVTTSASSQELRLSTVLTAENKEILPHHFLGKQDVYFWYLGSEVRQHHNNGGKMSMVLFKMDDALKVVEVFPLQVQEDDIQFLEKAFLHDGSVHLLVQKANLNRSKCEIFLNRYDLRGQLLDPLPLVYLHVKLTFGTLAPTWQHQTVVSPDGNWFYLYSINTSARGYEPLSIQLSMVDLSRDSVRNQEITLEGEKKYVYISALKLLGNDLGEAFMLYAINYAGPITRAEEKVKKLKKWQKRVIYPLNTSGLVKVSFGGERKEVKLNARRDLIGTVFAKLGKDNVLYYVDMLCLDRTSNAALHTYNLKRIDPESLEILLESSGTFNEFHFANLDGLKLDEGQFGPPAAAYLHDILLDQNGGMKLILRNSNVLNGQSFETVYTFHESIFVIDLDTQGDINWAITLPHGHLSDARLREGDILIKERNGSLLIFFNSVPKILSKDDTAVPKTGEARSLRMNQTVVGFITVDANGHYSKQALLEDYLGSGDFGQVADLSDDEFSFAVYTFKQINKPTGALLKIKME